MESKIQYIEGWLKGFFKYFIGHFTNMYKFLSILIFGACLAISGMSIYWAIMSTYPPIEFQENTKILTKEVKRGEYLEIQLLYTRNRACNAEEVTEYYRNVDTGAFKSYIRTQITASEPETRGVIAFNITELGEVNVVERIKINENWELGEWFVYADSKFGKCGINPFLGEEVVRTPTDSFKVIE